MVQKWHDIWLVHKTCSHATLEQERAYARGIQLFGKKARENPERFCGWFPVDCSSKKFARMALDAMDVCLRMLKESDKSRLDRCWSYPILSFGIVECTFIPTAFLEIAVFSWSVPENPFFEWLVSSKPRRKLKRFVTINELHPLLTALKLRRLRKRYIIRCTIEHV